MIFFGWNIWIRFYDVRMRFRRKAAVFFEANPLWMGGMCAKMSHFSGKCHWLKIVSPAEFKAPHKMMISLLAKTATHLILIIKVSSITLMLIFFSSLTNTESNTASEANPNNNLMMKRVGLSSVFKGAKASVPLIKGWTLGQLGQRSSTDQPECVMFRFEDHHHWGGFCVTRDLASPSPQMTERWQG